MPMHRLIMLPTPNRGSCRPVFGRVRRSLGLHGLHRQGIVHPDPAQPGQPPQDNGYHRIKGI